MRVVTEIKSSSKKELPLIDWSNQKNSARHGKEISEKDMELLFGREFIDKLHLILQEGPGEAAYIKGGRFSQLINFPLLRVDTTEKAALGDIDVKIVGRNTVEKLRENFPGRELRYQISKSQLQDGQEIDYQDCEKIRADMKQLVEDSVRQGEYAKQTSELTESQKIATQRAANIATEIESDFEKILLSAGLVRAKEAAIKVTKTPNGLEYTLCDPNNSLHDPEIFDRERHIHDAASSLLGEPILTARLLPNISEFSIHRLIMEMTVAFGHIETTSPIVMSTLPLVMNVIKGDAIEQLLFAADGLTNKKSFEDKPETNNLNKAIKSFGLIKTFLENVIENPQFTDLREEFVRQKTRNSDFAEYNIEVIKKATLESLLADTKTTLFYIFSYLPSLAKVAFPTIDALAPAQLCHNALDTIDQNMLDVHLLFDPNHERSPYLDEHRQALAFLRNLQVLTDTAFQQRWSVAIEGQIPRQGPGVFKQATQPDSINTIIAILLKASGKSHPHSGLLKTISTEWERAEFTAIAEKFEIPIDTYVTPSKIRKALNNLEAITLTE